MKLTFGNGFCVGWLLGGLLAVVAAALSLQLGDSHWQREAVKHGAASYDPQTGAWKWNEPAEGKSDG